ncbi:MAG: family 78 glycoside hydrolase catalytic domain [Sphingobacteriales bacterium]|nr:family 78 glycoside hydrolase catalytic domain [Sphingobacteriales bacterium]
MNGRNVFAIVFFSTTCCFFSGKASAQSDLLPKYLRTEYKVNPFIDTDKPRLSWELQSKVYSQVQTAWQIIVASAPDLLTEAKADAWNSGKISSNATSQIVYAGKPLIAGKKYYWKVRSWDKNGVAGAWSGPATWNMGLLTPNDWKAGWIGYDVNALSANKIYHLPPAPYFRKETVVSGVVKKATLYVSALGLYEFYVNGKRIGNDYFSPGWTDYTKRVYYNGYDVTREIKAGKNAFGAIVANGWYAGYLGYALLVGSKTTHAFYGDVPLLKAQVEIEYTDGQKEIVATDASWKAADGGIREADILNGETFNANLEPAGWNTAGFNASSWQPVQLYNEKAGLLMQMYPADPVGIWGEIKPVSITEESKGKYIVDMGQNFSGVVRITARANKGDSIVIKYGEKLFPNGKLVTENLRRARATDTYISKGSAQGETWMPRFTYHGFQYIEISGLKNKPGLNDIKGIVMTSLTPAAGSFATDNAILNQLYKNITWTQRSNYFDIPTDCPQRDERLGWTGDAQIYMRSATYNADIAAFHTKWITDLNDSQWPDGTYPVYSPMPVAANGKAAIRATDTYSPGWAEAGIVCPYNIYKMYGDTRIITEAWPYMVKYMQFLEKRSGGNYYFAEASFEDINPKGGFGDWLSVGKKTPPDMLATMYYNYCALMLAEMAKAIDNTDAAIYYSNISEKIKKGFAEHYIGADGKLTANAAAYGNGDGYVDGSLGFSGHTQTAYANAIYMHILSPDNLVKAGEYLQQLVEANNDQLATGFLGFKPLLPALSATGNSKLAYTLARDTAYPSLGFEVVNGSTTIWERWNSYIKGKGFENNAGMNSFNHYAFGAICEWMFQNMAGIQPGESAGFNTFVIKPEIAASDINYVKATYHSVKGEIRSSWKKINDQLEIEVSIPVNTRADVIIPSTSVERILINGKSLHEFNDHSIVEGNKAISVKLGSGNYNIVINE